MSNRDELERLIIDNVIPEYRTYVDEDIIAAAITAAGWIKSRPMMTAADVQRERERDISSLGGTGCAWSTGKP